jgi:hypothetical protein
VGSLVPNRVSDRDNATYKETAVNIPEDHEPVFLRIMWFMIVYLVVVPLDALRVISKGLLNQRRAFRRPCNISQNRQQYILHSASFTPRITRILRKRLYKLTKIFSYTQVIAESYCTKVSSHSNIGGVMILYDGRTYEESF